MGPVTIRNYRVSGLWVPISTNGGINLYIGNNPDSDRTIAIRPGDDWKALVLEPREAGATNTVEASRYFTQKVRDYAASEPASFATGLARKTLQTVNSRETPRNVDLYSFRQHAPVLAALTGSVGSVYLPFGLIAPLAALGMAVRFRKRDESHLLMGFVILYLLSVALFFPSARYRLPAIPGLIIFAAIGILHLLRSWKTPQVFRLWSMVPLGAAIVVNLPQSFPTDKIPFDAELYTNTGIGLHARGDVDTAVRYYERALEEDPKHVEALFQLAVVDLQNGKNDTAMMQLAHILEKDPHHARAYEQLGLIFFPEEGDGERRADLPQSP